MSLHHHLAFKAYDNQIEDLEKQITDLERQRDEWREMAKRLHCALEQEVPNVKYSRVCDDYETLVKKEGGPKPAPVVCCSCKTVLQPSKVFPYAGIPHCHECWKVEQDIDANCS